MRRMEEEVDYVGHREDFLSEDDHSPTDASEDSVEVKITPIKTPYHPAVSRPPTQLLHQLPSTHPFYHKFRKHLPTVPIKEEYDLKTLRRRISPQEDYEDSERQQLFSPRDFSRASPSTPHYGGVEIKHLPPPPQDYTVIRSSPGVISPPGAAHHHTVLHPSPPTSPVESLPMGAAPLSPGTRAAAARSRRKPAEPRRLCHDGSNHNNNNKRSHSPEPPLKPVKLARTDSGINDDKSVGSSPSPGAPPLLAHHPLLGPLGRPPMGAFPPLLLPPAWPPVAAQWGYPRVVTPLGWAGLTPGLTPHPYPMLLPHHYPLSRPLLHPHLQPPTAASPPSKSPPPRSPLEDPSKEDLPLPLVTRIPPPPPQETPSTSSSTSSSSIGHHPHPHHPSHPLSHPHSHPLPVTREVSVVKKIGKAPSKFLSVESLIGADSPSSGRPLDSTPIPPDCDDDGLGAPSLAGDDDDTIHSLLQPGKQKQRNYKNMTRERRIEANARERNRVHTISAAFEKLRTSVPAYSHNQKLSKLSVLRIACSYIVLLSRLAGQDYSEGGEEPSVNDCVDHTTKTIQVEGKAKKKRDE